jgi:hypothetical protein
MDIRELMIGDWVFYKNEPIMVYGINDSNDDDRINYEDDGYGGCSYICADEAYPIPLSDEILIKSGFVKNQLIGENEYFDGKATKDFSYSISIRHRHRMKGEFFIRVEQMDESNIKRSNQRGFIGYILYVHELQNILRSARIEKDIIV